MHQSVCAPITYILELDIAQLAQFRHSRMGHLSGDVELQQTHLRRSEEGLISGAHLD